MPITTGGPTPPKHPQRVVAGAAAVAGAPAAPRLPAAQAQEDPRHARSVTFYTSRSGRWRTE